MASSRVQILNIEPHSDGDASHRPKPEWQLLDPPHIYLEKLALLWLHERGETPKSDTRYYLSGLPTGYALFERARPSNAKLKDKHLYGHPSHKFFDSPNRFFPHFLHLMRYGTSHRCPCTICNAKGSQPLPVRPKGRPSHQVHNAKVSTSEATKSSSVSNTKQPTVESLDVDEENTPDLIRQYLNQIKARGSIDEPFQERRSMDWRAERRTLSSWLDRLQNQKSWIPRVGEVVLFVRSIEGGEICKDDRTNEFKVYSLDMDEFTGHPKWEAGVVSQVPAEPLDLRDLLMEYKKDASVTYSGFRIEPLPDPNGDQKSLSKRYQYVPLHFLRPFVFWREYLCGVSPKHWHPTVNHALTVSTCLSVFGKYYIKGEWPEAAIFCRGLHIGPELLVLGDAVRLLPNDETDGDIADILHITKIKLCFSNLHNASEDDHDQGHPYNTSILITGKGYTLDQSSAFANTPVLTKKHRSSFPSGMTGYDNWYPLHDPSKFMQIHFSRIAGRLFEAEPMLIWFPPSNEGEDAITCPSLSHGLEGTKRARNYASSHDDRLTDGRAWYWADNRAEGLGIAEMNGLAVSGYDLERDEEKLNFWADDVRYLERQAGQPPNYSRMGVNNRAASTASGAVKGAGEMAPPRAQQTDADDTEPDSDDEDEVDHGDDPNEQFRDELEGHNKVSSTSAAPSIEGRESAVETPPPDFQNQQTRQLSDSDTRMDDNDPNDTENHIALAARFGLGLGVEARSTRVADTRPSSGTASRKRSHSATESPLVWNDNDDDNAGSRGGLKEFVDLTGNGDEGTDMKRARA